MGADFSMVVSRSYTPAHLATTMWNHAPVMFGAMESAGIEKPKLTPGDAADLFAFFYSTRFFDKPGNAARGKAAFTENRCADCHGVNESKARKPPRSRNGRRWPTRWCSSSRCGITAPDAGRLRAPQDPVAAADQRELNDMLSWLRSLPETRHLPSHFSNTTDRDGHKVFEAKGCVKCHVGKLALEDRLRNMTLTDIAVDMWNHAPRMVKPTPSLNEDEMRELLSFLWMRQFVYPKGSIARGREVFQSRRCVRPATPAANTAPRNCPGRRKPTRRSRLFPQSGDTARRCSPA